MKIKTFAISVAAALLVGLISGVFIHRGYVLKHSSPVQRDTVTVWKTTEVIRPVPIESHVGDTPISLPAERFTRSATDSTLLEALPDMVTFRDSLENGTKYTAVLSGIKPSIEALSISYPQRTITNTVTVPYKGWDMGLKAEAFATGQNDFSALFFTGVEFAYNTGALHIGIDAGCTEQYFRPSGWAFAPYVGASLKIDLFHFK